MQSGGQARRRSAWAATAGQAVVVAALWWLPSLALAHSPVPGLGRFYNGMLHPVLAPAALIALAALGVLLGQHGLLAVRRPMLLLVLSLAVGLWVGSEWPGLRAAADADALLTAVGAAAAACALAAWKPPPLLLLLLASAVGGLVGVGLSDMAEGTGRWLVIAGTWLGAALLALGTAATSELARQPWQHVGLRVVASWLAASALLVLGLQWAGPLPVG